MSNTSTLRSNEGFQYRLRFFHKCRSPGALCDLGQIDRFQIQGSALESTCGAPIIVVLVRYRHDPDSGLSRECQRAQLAPGAPQFGLKVIVVPADEALAYVDQSLLQQPRLVDSQGRNLLGGPDVSPDGCIFVTTLEKNGIAHLNNFCLLQPYTGPLDRQEAAASGTGQRSAEPDPGLGLGMGLGLQQQRSCGAGGGRGGGGSSGPEATRRVRAMLGGSASEGGAAAGGLGPGNGLGCLGGGSEVMRDSADALSASSELCLLVQLLRRDAQAPGRWFAYDMPHLISRPFQVVSYSALAVIQHPDGQQQQVLPLAPGRGLSSPRHSAGFAPVLGLGTASPGQEPMPAHPQPFISPQHKRHVTTGGCGSVANSGLAAHGSGLGLTSRLKGVVGGPQQQQQPMLLRPQMADCGLGFGMTGRDWTEAMLGGGGMGLGDGMGMGAGMGVAPGVIPGVGSMVAMGGGARAGAGGSGGSGGGGLIGGFLLGERSCGGGGGGQLSSMSVESPNGTSGSHRGSHRGSRARRRSLLSKDSSLDNDNSSVGPPMTVTTSGATGGDGVAALRTRSITSGADPAAQRAAMQAAGAVAPSPSPPLQAPSRLVHVLSSPCAGAGLGWVPGTDVAAAARSSEEGRMLPLRQAPSATLLDFNISDLLNDIQPQALLHEDIMELGEGAAKRGKPEFAAPDAPIAFMSESTSHNNNSMDNHNSGIKSCSGQPVAETGSPRCGHVSPPRPHQQQQLQLPPLEVYLGCGGHAGRAATRSGGGCGGDGHLYQAAAAAVEGQPSRTASWSADMAPEQLMSLRKQSTGFSGTHTSSSFALANGSTSLPCSGPTPPVSGYDTAAGAAGGGGVVPDGDVVDGVRAAGCDGGGGGRSGASSGSQLDLLVQLLGQPGAIQEALDRMDQERLQQQQEEEQ